MTKAPETAALPWQSSQVARAVHAGVALLCAAGLLSSLYLGWTAGTELPDGVGYAGGFSAGWPHLVNQPAYFTFLSALLVCVTSALLAIQPVRTSWLFSTLRLAGVVQVIITGVVFNLLLRSGAELSGVWLFNDKVLHIIVPVLVPIVWLIFGPHGRVTARIVAGSTVLPLLWLAVTLVRGPMLDWYPYTILDVPGMGAAGVAPYVASILLAFVAIAGVMWGIDRVIYRSVSR
ncbi:hypothetical protein FEF26_07345 [Nesterenkonia salmonea]|uniref:F420-dependent oxidoreductase n=1 Tax=Nesterenkonia salmonea TaxID=1804987 RepID=A0A5R9BB15_9MICC|nr:Pr6Pr family membrane protein [Nesterenkonia salmonea]TLP97412.1 hypothetical protein FEF26_07345 [Nesterenkonia salmonea]